MMEQFEIFRQLHHNKEPFILGNCWDAGSAQLLEENGFKAIASSSAAVAHTLGYRDGEHLPFALLIETVKRIKNNISLPLSVDLERGYSTDIPGILDNVEKLCAVGVAGINIEDTTADRKLRPIQEFEKIISAIANHLSKNNLHLYINARTDAFLLGLPNALPETLQRVKILERAGAGGIFVPFVTAGNDIQAITNATSLPLNVLAAPQLPGLSVLTSLGVKRVSLGSALYNAIKRDLISKVKAMQQDQSLRSLF